MSDRSDIVKRLLDLSSLPLIGRGYRGHAIRSGLREAAAYIAELERALEPFADIGGLMPDTDGWSDTDMLYIEADPHFGHFATMNAGHFRRTAAIRKLPEEAAKP